MKRIIFIVIPLLFIACAEEKDVLVKVDGAKLTKSEFEQYIPGQDYKMISDEKIRGFLNDWVEQEILYLQAKRLKMDQEDSVKFVLEQYKKNFLALELVRREFGSATVTESEIKAYFDQHRDEFLYAVKVGQMVLSNYDLAVRSLEEIKAGADFFKLARERSLTRYQDPENPQIITDWLQRGMIADFATEEIIFNMKPGELSGVIPYIQGTYLIVKLIDKRKVKAKVELTDDLKGKIYNYLMASKYQEFLADYVDSLKSFYKITIDISPLRK